PAITAPAPAADADAPCAFSSAAAIGAASRPGRARTLLLLLLGSHDLTCSTGHQPLRCLLHRRRPGLGFRTDRKMGGSGSLGDGERNKATRRVVDEGGLGGFVELWWLWERLCFCFRESSSGLVGARVACAL
ncbi:unnamed protein product, partial [Urochloa humidicola]